jgi:SAM-dependent methyltransferase
MLGLAAQRAANLHQVRFVHADASTHVFDGGADCLFSRFGVMFFADPRAAFSNLRKALVPGGRLSFVCWRALAENEWMAVPLAAVSTVVPPAPSQPDAPGPFAFADAGRVRSILEGSGFAQVATTPFDYSMSLGDGRGVDAAVAESVSLGPAARMLKDADAGTKARAEAAVRAALTPYARGSEVRLRAAAWIVTAVG